MVNQKKNQQQKQKQNKNGKAKKSKNNNGPKQTKPKTIKKKAKAQAPKKAHTDAQHHKKGKGSVAKKNAPMRRVDTGARRLNAPAPKTMSASAKQAAYANQIIRPSRFLKTETLSKDGRLEAAGSAQLAVVPANAIVIDDPLFDVPGTSSYMFMAMAEAFLLVSNRSAPPTYTQQSVDGVLTPLTRKFYLLWALMTALRKVGSLVASGGNDIMALFPDFPEEAMIPVGWLNYIRGYMPYTDKNGTQFGFVFTLDGSKLADTFSGALAISANPFINPALCTFPTLALVGTAPNQEWNMSYTVTGTKTFRSIMSTDIDQLSEYWQSVYPCAAFEKMIYKAPNASAYCQYGRAVTCATSEFMQEHAPLYISQGSSSLSAPATFIRTPQVVAREVGPCSMNSVDDDKIYIVLNYAIMSLDYTKPGSISQAHADSPWAPAVTFAPNLINADLRFLSEIIQAANEAYATSVGQGMALLVVLWSKFIRASFKSSLFPMASTNPGRNVDVGVGSPITGVFDDLPVPPAFMEYLSGFGPTIADGRVTWPVYAVPGGKSVAAGQNGWVGLLTNGQLGSQNFPAGYIYTPNLQVSSAPSVGGIIFNATNFPGTNKYVPCPEYTADNFIEEYVALTGYQNFIAVEVTRFGLIDCVCATNILPTARNTSQFAAKNNMVLFTLYDIEYVLAPRLLTSADVVRIAHHNFRTTDGTGNVLRLYPHRSARLRLTGPTYTLAKFFSSGSGFTVMNEELAQREAQTEYGVSVAGMTQPTETHEENNLFTVRSIANEFFSEGAEKLVGMDFKSIGQTATEALAATAKMIVSEFIPFSGPILDAAVALGKPMIEKVLKRDAAPVVHRKKGRAVEDI